LAWPLAFTRYGEGPGTQLDADKAVVWHELWEGRPDDHDAWSSSGPIAAAISENFPWTRLPGVVIPAQRKPPVVWPEDGNPGVWKEALGDGQFGGLYQRSPEDESRLWAAAVQAIRQRLEDWEVERRQLPLLDPRGV
jgi:creatinine amidohydrolase